MLSTFVDDSSRTNLKDESFNDLLSYFKEYRLWRFSSFPLFSFPQKDADLAFELSIMLDAKKQEADVNQFHAFLSDVYGKNQADTLRDDLSVTSFLSMEFLDVVFNDHVFFDDKDYFDDGEYFDDNVYFNNKDYVDDGEYFDDDSFYDNDYFYDTHYFDDEENDEFGDGYFTNFYTFSCSKYFAMIEC